eukprot:749795-Hanusia_phi.AAC.9
MAIRLKVAALRYREPAYLTGEINIGDELVQINSEDFPRTTQADVRSSIDSLNACEDIELGKPRRLPRPDKTPLRSCRFHPEVSGGGASGLSSADQALKMLLLLSIFKLFDSPASERVHHDNPHMQHSRAQGLRRTRNARARRLGALRGKQRACLQSRGGQFSLGRSDGKSVPRPEAFDRERSSDGAEAV